MCKICQDNQVKNIDPLLLSGHTPASVSQHYSVFTPAELPRQAEHLQDKMALASGRFQASPHQGLFRKLHTPASHRAISATAARQNRDATATKTSGCR